MRCSHGTLEHDPLAQAFTDRTGPHRNFSFDSRKRSYRTGSDFKLDHSFSDCHKIFGRYSNLRNRAWPYDILQGPFANTLFDYQFTAVPADSHQLAVSDSITISPTTINEFRVGANRRKTTRVPESYGKTWPASLVFLTSAATRCRAF